MDVDPSSTNFFGSPAGVEQTTPIGAKRKRNGEEDHDHDGNQDYQVQGGATGDSGFSASPGFDGSGSPFDMSRGNSSSSFSAGAAGLTPTRPGAGVSGDHGLMERRESGKSMRLNSHISTNFNNVNGNGNGGFINSPNQSSPLTGSPFGFGFANSNAAQGDGHVNSTNSPSPFPSNVNSSHSNTNPFAAATFGLGTGSHTNGTNSPFGMAQPQTPGLTERGGSVDYLSGGQGQAAPGQMNGHDYFTPGSTPIHASFPGASNNSNNLFGNNSGGGIHEESMSESDEDEFAPAYFNPLSAQTYTTGLYPTDQEQPSQQQQHHQQHQQQQQGMAGGLMQPSTSHGGGAFGAGAGSGVDDGMMEIQMQIQNSSQEERERLIAEIERARNVHGPQCGSIPRLQLSDYPDQQTGKRTMYSICDNCGAVEPVA